jgi:hypothetical protein
MSTIKRSLSPSRRFTHVTQTPKKAASSWQPLYQASGVAAAIIAVFIPVQVIIFAAWPPPTTVMGPLRRAPPGWSIAHDHRFGP